MSQKGKSLEFIVPVGSYSCGKVVIYVLINLTAGKAGFFFSRSGFQESVYIIGVVSFNSQSHINRDSGASWSFVGDEARLEASVRAVGGWASRGGEI